MKKARLLLLMTLLALLSVNKAQAAEAYAVFSGNTLTFYYDSNKKSRSGNVYGMNSTGLPGWNTHKASIQKVVFDASFANARPTSCRSWFYECSNLTTITGIGYLNTSEATTMYCMFYKCSALTNLDVSKFNTAKVTTMRGMFYNCGNVKVLNVSGFNTANVTSMRTMFYNCAGVSTLDVSHFNTAKVEDFNQMFYECNGLTKLDLSSFTFNTGITSQNMIPIAGLKWLAVPNTANNLEDNTCAKIGTKAAPCELSYPSGFTPQKTSTGNGWYMWKSGYFKDAVTIPDEPDEEKGYAVLSGTTLSFYYDDIYNTRSGTVYDLNSGSNKPAWNAKASTVKTVYFDESFAEASPTSTYYWFGGMTNLTSINGIENLDTWAVTNMAYMFYGCSNLNTLIVGNFNTSRVTNMAYMFSGCSKLTDLKLYYDWSAVEYFVYETNFTTKAATNLSNMFSGCSSLKELVLSKFTLTSGANTTDFLKGCSALKTLYIDTNLNSLNASALSGVGTASAPCLVEYHERDAMPEPSSIKPTYYVWKGGYCRSLQKGFAELSKDGKTLTFKYEIFDNYSWMGDTRDIYPLNGEEESAEWAENASNVTKVVFEEDFKYVRPVSTNKWFYGMTKLTSIVGIGYLNTSEVINMGYMFTACHSLPSVDVSGFNTAKVTNMEAMFGECRLFNSLNLSNFNTAQVGNMRNMFAECTNLSSINVSSFNTSDAGYMQKMFYGCSSLTSLNVSNFNVTNARYVYEMFAGCSKLKELDISKFVFREPVLVGTMMDYIYAYSMFNGCSSLEYLSIPASIKNLNEEEDDLCEGVGTASKPCSLAYPAGFTPKKTSIGNGYYVWKKGYFKDATTATTKPYAVLSGSTLTFYYDASYGSRSGTVYDLNSGNTAPDWNSKASTVTKVVFDSNFADARPTSCYKWFYGMSNITGITGLNYLNTSEVESMYCMFYKCSKLTDIDLSSFNTEKVEDMEAMFFGCYSLTSLDLSSIQLAYTFECIDEVELHCDNFLKNCASLKSLTVPKTVSVYVGLSLEIYPDHEEWVETYEKVDANQLPSDAFSGIGTPTAPCTLIYPSGFTPHETSTGNGWYMWKGGYFKDAFKMGDANGDRSVSVSDVMMTVNYVLGATPPEGFHFDNANVNGDKVITVADVMAIVDIVLSNTSNNAPAHSRYSGADGMGLSANDGHCTVVLDNSEPFTALQFTIVMPESAELGHVAMMQARSDGHQVKTKAVAPGRYNMVVFAPSGAPLRNGTTALLHFDYSGCQPGDIAIEGAQLVNSQYETVLPTGVVTAITGIEADGAADGQMYYNTVGIGVKNPTRGVYISNGAKIVVK